MKLSVIAAALALNIVTGGTPLTGSELHRAIRNYKAILAGQKQLVDLPLPERRDVIELDQWVRSQRAIVPPETKAQCKARLGSESPSQLEDALLDLKCSQRPASQE
jgi:hypothetical protein